ncbi:hypothetical protein [Campylobacter vulpis]|uniref:hypothetical protein n=1 Tax=Campylobacter vulpis TaxID=1655500 RepID=UPI000C15ADEB|nr:hypothetical protein [Campylobacter vulpis]MBS4275592.1 hypothetical protein [Campylobacter vulpis]MBS4306825.1 hypothetical protein [Campylobacter vulpis]MBS4329933.1 hypothetical protein [Campylobacter vulpis]MBS4407597.1 hypothetical protein [Campylobacter vulpis]MBS4423580.1 hypothetical protein [Campylobacter vulpis]
MLSLLSNPALMGVGTALSGVGSVFSALDNAFGTGRQNVKIAKEGLNLAKAQWAEENKRYNENKANIQSNLDMIGSVFSDDNDSVWDRK